MPGVVERLKSLRPRLETAFTFNLVDLASQMNEIGFLSDDDYSTVSASKTMFSDRERAHTMVESLIKKVDLNPRNYATFLEMVKKDARKFGSVVEVLSAEESSSATYHPPGGSVQQVPQGYQQTLLSQQQGYPMSSGYGQPLQYMGGPQEIPRYFSNPPVYQGSGGGGGIPVQYQVPHSSDGLRPSQSAGMMQPTPGSVLFNQGLVPCQSDSISQNGAMPKERRAPSEAEGSQSTLDSVDDTTLDEEDLTEVLNEVEEISAKWKVLGTKLGIKSGTKEAIKKDNDTSLECLDEILTAWLKLNYDYQCHGKPSWRKLAEAVRSLNGSLFEKIVKNHGTKVPVVGRREAGATKATANIGIMKRRKTVPALGRSITMQKLLMIKWQTSAESIHYLRIMELAANQWKTLGGLLKISSATLESYETQHMKKNEECIRSVFKKWIEATSEEYPTTWYGLIMLLDCADLSSVADALESLAVEHPEAL